MIWPYYLRLTEDLNLWYRHWVISFIRTNKKRPMLYRYTMSLTLHILFIYIYTDNTIDFKHGCGCLTVIHVCTFYCQHNWEKNDGSLAWSPCDKDSGYCASEMHRYYWYSKFSRNKMIRININFSLLGVFITTKIGTVFTRIAIRLRCATVIISGRI